MFKGKRIALRTLLASLAGGDSLETILTDLPSLEPEDIRAAIAFATASAEEDLPVLSVPSRRFDEEQTFFSCCYRRVPEIFGKQ